MAHRQMKFNLTGIPASSWLLNRVFAQGRKKKKWACRWQSGDWCCSPRASRARARELKTPSRNNNRKIQQRRARRPVLQSQLTKASQPASNRRREKIERRRNSPWQKEQLQFSLVEQHFNLPACHCGTRCAAFQKHTDSARLSSLSHISLRAGCK